MPIRLDAVRSHLDANETLFFARELESIEATLYEFKKTELRYREFIPVSNADNPGAETITYYMYDMVGMAKIISNYADDLPRADVFAKSFTLPVKGLGSSFGYSTQDLRAAAMANRSLDDKRAASSRRSIRERESAIAWKGDSSTGLQGFLTNANIPILAAAAGAGGTTWALKTADEIIADIRAMISKVRTQSKGVHRANTLLLPIAQYDIIAGLPRSINSDTTVLKFVKDPSNGFGLTTIDALPVELDNAFTGGTEDGAICYERDSEVLEQRIPLEMITLPVQARNLEFIIPVESRHGGVVVRYPLGCLFFTGI